MNAARRAAGTRKSGQHLADGAWAERRALALLKRHGLKLVETNFTCRFGEIDLIMRDAQTVVFVEVRLRGSTAYGHPVESVDRRKQQRIRLSAEWYLLQSGSCVDVDCRFDLIGIVGNRDRHEVQWIRDAF